MSSLDPYRVVGLRQNPFVVEEHELVIPAELWLDRNFPATPEPSQKRLIQIIGPPGTGKTSLLCHWREKVPGPYLHYPPGLGRFRFPPVSPIAFWDEADRIPKLLLNIGLQRAARIKATLICGTHEDLTTPAVRAGLTVETIEPASITPKELIAWSELRIHKVQLDPLQPTALRLTNEEAKQIVKQAQHSWRTAADLLHVWTARRVAGRSTDLVNLEVRSQQVGC